MLKTLFRNFANRKRWTEQISLKSDAVGKKLQWAVNEGYSLVDELELDDQSLGCAVVDFSLLSRDHDADKLSAAHRAYVNSPEPWQVCVWSVVTKEEESKVFR